EVEGVEVEVLLEPGLLERAALVDLDPAEALGSDLLDLGGLGLRRKRRDELAGAGAAESGTREVRHLPVPLLSSRRFPSQSNCTEGWPDRRTSATGFVHVNAE